MTIPPMIKLPKCPHKLLIFMPIVLLASLSLWGLVLLELYILASEYALWQRRSAAVEMTNDSEDLPNVDNQEHPPPVSIRSDEEIPIEESDEGEENVEDFFPCYSACYSVYLWIPRTKQY
ncbi:hypothetical protein RJ640_000620 [Escallonia rubra]|uniref:Uncharacterized protein n=1 Tax=Escallonia rubra TaxID=112253 RepID=A0AA88U0G4_9ASTE|nr:hypothetical protein RJ640_000620 [Escallonia rubra]